MAKISDANERLRRNHLARQRPSRPRSPRPHGRRSRVPRPRRHAHHHTPRRRLRLHLPAHRPRSAIPTAAQPPSMAASGSSATSASTAATTSAANLNNTAPPSPHSDEELPIHFMSQFGVESLPELDGSGGLDSTPIAAAVVSLRRKASSSAPLNFYALCVDFRRSLTTPREDMPLALLTLSVFRFKCCTAETFFPSQAGTTRQACCRSLRWTHTPCSIFLIDRHSVAIRA